MHRALALVALCLALPGCAGLGYYGQALGGQWDLLTRRERVATLLEDPDTPSLLRQRLVLTRAMRAFAAEQLALPSGGSYRHYVALDRPYAVWVVYAAPRLSMTPRQHCFPLLGCLSYLGFFSTEDAEAHATARRRVGDDVYVSGVAAYSTLGWFDDPLLSTFLGWPEGRLAELVFHELAHRRLYVAGDTGFNEAYATAVGQLGARRWLAARGSAGAREAYDRDLERRRAFLALVLPARARLEQLYASDLDADRKGAAKARVLRDLARAGQALPGYEAWFGRSLNNAALVAVGAYHRHVPAFEALFTQVGQDFAAFHEAVKRLGALSPAGREARLVALVGAGELGQGAPGPAAAGD